MRKSELRSIIREEMINILSESVQPKQMVNEMASFYKVVGDEEEAKEVVGSVKKQLGLKPGSAIYNILDKLETEGQVDFRALANETGKDIATWNNPKVRDLLDKKLVDYVIGSSSPSNVKGGGINKMADLQIPSRKSTSIPAAPVPPAKKK